MENNFMVNFDPSNIPTAVFKDGKPEEKKIRLKKGYKKSEELINFANEKLVEIENRIGMKLNGFSELYDNLSVDDQKKFVDLLKASEAEQAANTPRSKHPCTRKKKKQIKVKHGNRKKK